MQRELQTTCAFEVPKGAELVGGNHDGIEVLEVAVSFPASESSPQVTLRLACFCVVTVPSNFQVMWLPPGDDNDRQAV